MLCTATNLIGETQAIHGIIHLSYCTEYSYLVAIAFKLSRAQKAHY